MHYTMQVASLHAAAFLQCERLSNQVIVATPNATSYCRREQGTPVVPHQYSRPSRSKDYNE